MKSELRVPLMLSELLTCSGTALLKRCGTVFLQWKMNSIQRFERKYSPLARPQH